MGFTLSSLLLITFASSQCSARLEICAPSPGAGSYETSLYLHYGPRRAEIEGPAIYLDGPELCAINPDSVHGKVVLSDRRGAFCGLDELYESLNDFGALAFVHFVIYDPPGLMASRHGSLEADKYRGSRMTMVDSSLG